MTKIKVWCIKVSPPNFDIQLAWLLVLPEWRYFLFLSYSIKPHDLLSHCDGCGEAFSICHTLDCKKGGLITAFHNELHDGVVDLQEKTLLPRTYAMTPRYSQVATYMRVRLKSNQQGMTSSHCRWRRGAIWGTFWSGICGPRGQTVFTTCVSWILTSSPTIPKPWRSAQRPPSAKWRESTSYIYFKQA